VVYLETNKLRQRKRYLKAEAIIKYFKGNDMLETEIMCGTSNDLVTSDQSLYEALGSFEDKSQIDLNKLVKLLEVVEIVSYNATFKQPRKILTPKRVDQLNELINNKSDKKLSDESNTADSNANSNLETKSDVNVKPDLDLVDNNESKGDKKNG
jgi:hypothetical protein